FHARGSGGGGGRLFGGPGGGAGGGGPGASGGAGGGGQNGGGFRQFFSPLPQTPPADPFAAGTNPATCSAENAPKAQQLSSELKAYVAKIEAARTAAGYPATMAAPALSDATVIYHGLGTTYALAITPKGSGTLRALAGCIALHIARADDVTQHKLYAASSPLFFVPQVTFMPAVGLYIVARQQTPGQEAFRVYKLPTSPPKAPFEVRTATACTGQVKNLAMQALEELRKHFADGSPAPSWTITPHAAKSGTWYELDPGDPTVVPALLYCGHVATASADELSALGYDGKLVPELNYAPALGIYLLPPARRNNGGAAPASSPAPSP
ncbi:MAG: hypothetical protein WBE83_07780, partial [Candidatus Cybelea sp.]